MALRWLPSQAALRLRQIRDLQSGSGIRSLPKPVPIAGVHQSAARRVASPVPRRSDRQDASVSLRSGHGGGFPRITEAGIGIGAVWRAMEAVVVGACRSGPEVCPASQAGHSVPAFGSHRNQQIPPAGRVPYPNRRICFLSKIRRGRIWIGWGVPCAHIRSQHLVQRFWPDVADDCHLCCRQGRRVCPMRRPVP
jgi:hypothetical protein